MTESEIRELSGRMLHYFLSDCTDTGSDIPSFVRFAAMEKIGMHKLRELRETSKYFATVWEECKEILCDRVADGALHRKLDGSFAKFLLSEKYGYTIGEEAEEESFGVRITLSEPPDG